MNIRLYKLSSIEPNCLESNGLKEFMACELICSGQVYRDPEKDRSDHC